MSITLVLMQQGIVRPQGFQAVQWMTVVPQGSTHVATNPTTYVPIFLMRNEYGHESLERVCTELDLVTYAQSELALFEARGAGGNTLLSSALPGDQLVFTDPSLVFWLQDAPTYPPYDTNSFTVKQVIPRVSGTLPQILLGNQVILPGYTPTLADVGRWVYLSGFTTSTYNGYNQITGVTGTVLTLATPTSTNETGASWGFNAVQIEPYPLDGGTPPTPRDYDPRYFPTKVNNAPWALQRASAVLASNTSGGTTLRPLDGTELLRASRVTTLEPTLDAALARFAATKAAVQALQAAAAIDGTSFTSILVSTFGP